MARPRRAPTVLMRTRRRTKIRMTEEAKRMGKKMPDFVDMMFKKYKGDINAKHKFTR